MKNLLYLVFGIVVLLAIINLGAYLQDAKLGTDLKSAQVELTQSQAELNSAQARKANAEAHRIEDDLKRDQYGWRDVWIEESGLGNVIGVFSLIAVFGLSILLFFLGLFVSRPPWGKRG